jgi:hypothetical protein
VTGQPASDGVTLDLFSVAEVDFKQVRNANRRQLRKSNRSILAGVETLESKVLRTGKFASLHGNGHCALTAVIVGGRTVTWSVAFYR